MKKIFCITIFLLSSLIVSAQNTPKGSFKVLNNTGTQNESYIEQCILKANLEAYRLKNKKTVLHFENGFDLELSPASALKSLDPDLDVNNYRMDYDVQHPVPTFKIVANGDITVKHFTLTKVELSK